MQTICFCWQYPWTSHEQCSYKDIYYLPVKCVLGNAIQILKWKLLINMAYSVLKQRNCNWIYIHVSTNAAAACFPLYSALSSMTINLKNLSSLRHIWLSCVININTPLTFQNVTDVMFCYNIGTVYMIKWKFGLKPWSIYFIMYLCY